jgi:hypothetical protein
MYDMWVIGGVIMMVERRGEGGVECKVLGEFCGGGGGVWWLGVWWVFLVWCWFVWSWFCVCCMWLGGFFELLGILYYILRFGVGYILCRCFGGGIGGGF